MMKEPDQVGMEDIREVLLMAYDYIKSVDREFDDSGGKRGEPMDKELKAIARVLSIWGDR